MGYSPVGTKDGTCTKEIPIFWEYIIVVILSIIFTVIGLFMFRKINLEKYQCAEQNRVTAIFIGIMASFLGITLSFLIVSSWMSYKTAIVNNKMEAENLFILYEILSTIPGMEDTQQLIIDYLKHIINIEFPSVNNGLDSDLGQLYLQTIQREIYNYKPETTQQATLYQQAISLTNVLIDNRINRIIVMTEGLNTLIWWVAIIDALLLIFMSWILTCKNYYHYLLVIILTIYVSTALFTIHVLSNPYTRSAGITSDAFIKALDNILIIYDQEKKYNC